MPIETPIGVSSPVTLLSDSGELTGAAANFDVQNIAQGFVDLAFVLTARGDTAATNVIIAVTVNGDSATNYDWEMISATAAAPGATEGVTTAGWNGWNIAAATAPANVFDVAEGTLFGYSSTTLQKVMHMSADRKLGTTSGNFLVRIYAGFWRNTAAINRLTFTPAAGNFAAGSRLRIYGRL